MTTARTIGERLARIAALRSSDLALCGGGREVTFGALDAGATTVAHTLAGPTTSSSSAAIRWRRSSSRRC